MQRYVDRFIKSPGLPNFTSQIYLYKASNSHCNEKGIYLPQKICVNAKELVNSFDNEFSDFVASTSMTTFFTDQFNKIRNQPEVPILGFKSTHPNQPINTELHVSTAMRLFEEVDAVGNEISYRCPKCRECKDCKHDSNEIISIKEEIEQTIINKSVTIDFDKGITKALLPFIPDPMKRLSNSPLCNCF